MRARQVRDGESVLADGSKVVTRMKSHPQVIRSGGPTTGHRAVFLSHSRCESPLLSCLNHPQAAKFLDKSTDTLDDCSGRLDVLVDVAKRRQNDLERLKMARGRGDANMKK